MYTFRDVVGLRTIAILRNVHKLPLQELRRVGAWLVQHHETPWASLTLYVAGKAVLFEDPGSGQILSTRDGGQSVLRIELERVASQTLEELAGLKARAPSEIGAIMQNRYVVRNLPVVAGTRVPTAAVWNLHSGGYSPADIIKEFPRLTAKDVAAAIEFERTRRAEAAV